MERLVRFFGVVGPSCANQEYWWPDISFKYASALDNVGVRIIPIGAMQLEPDPRWKQWVKLRHCFVGELGDRYVNVVCCPPSVRLGVPLTGKDLASPCDYTRATTALTSKGENATNKVSYAPKLALVGLHTDGVRNIAITTAYRSAPDGKRIRNTFDAAEIDALHFYDAVVAPTSHDERGLRELNIAAKWLSPLQLSDAVAVFTREVGDV